MTRPRRPRASRSPPTASSRSRTASSMQRGAASVWKTDDVRVDTVVPENTSAAAPTAWQTTALSLALTGTERGSGVDHDEWRVDGGATRPARPRGRPPRARRLLRDAGRRQGGQRVRVAHRRPSRSTTPSRRTRPRCPAPRGCTPTSRRPSPARDATPACAGRVLARRRRDSDVRERDDHRRGHAQADDSRRRRRRQRLGLAHGHGRHRQDRADAGRRLRHHRLAQHAAACSVAATAGCPALRASTARRDGGRRRVLHRRRRGLTTVDFRAVDGAGNETAARARSRSTPRCRRPSRSSA